MESKNIPIRKPFPSPTHMQKLDVEPGDIPTLEQLMAMGGMDSWIKKYMTSDPNGDHDPMDKEGPKSDSATRKDPAQVMEGGEDAGLTRLRFYLWEGRHIDTYKLTRNGLLGGTYATKFSPWLATGCLGVRKVYEEVKKYEAKHGANDSTYWVFFELLWRDYFKWIGLHHKNDIFQLYGLKGEKKSKGDRKWLTDPKLFDSWARGETGLPFVDANMRELTATGHMSNRGRQNVASFLTKDMDMDWRMGAEFFESFLIDHDVTSNYCNWMYVAGVGNDPREDRYFNVVKQGHMYDAKGEYVCYWLPQLRKLPNSDVKHQPHLFRGPESTFVVDRDYFYPLPRFRTVKMEGHRRRISRSRSTTEAK